MFRRGSLLQVYSSGRSKPPIIGEKRGYGRPSCRQVKSSFRLLSGKLYPGVQFVLEQPFENQAVQRTDVGRSLVHVDVRHTRNPLFVTCRKHYEEGVLCERRWGERNITHLLS